MLIRRLQHRECVEFSLTQTTEISMPVSALYGIAQAEITNRQQPLDFPLAAFTFGCSLHACVGSIPVFGILPAPGNLLSVEFLLHRFARRAQ
jgi:hypothetical protein